MNLPDIKAQVKVDTSGITAADAKLAVFAEGVKRSLDDNSPAGRALVQFGKNGEVASLKISSATAKTRADLDALANRARVAAESLGKDLGEGTRVLLNLGEDGSAALGKLSQAAEGAAQPVETVVTDLGALGTAGPYAVAAIVAVAAAAAVAVAPVVGLAASLAAVLALGGGILGVFGGLGVAAVLLSQRVSGLTTEQQRAVAAHQQLTQATEAHQVAVKQLETLQNSLKGHRATADQLQLLATLQQQVKSTSYDMVAAQNAVKAAGEETVTPLQKLTDHVGKLADGLGKQATPAANMLYDWLGKLADKIAPVASKLLDWFQERLPKVLPIVDKVMADIGSSLEGLGKRLGPIIDDWIQHPEHFEKAFKETADKVISVTGDIIQKAQQLANWWADHHVELEKDSSIVFGTIGSLANEAVQIVRVLIATFNTFRDGYELAASVASVASARISGGLAAIEGAANRAGNAIGFLLLSISRLPGAGGLTNIAANIIGSSDIGNLGSGKRAKGGSVVPGRVYDIGEEGPEKLVMYPGGGGGYVIPNSGNSGPVEVSNMASTRRIERQLDQQTALLAQIASSSSGPMFSNRAYGS